MTLPRSAVRRPKITKAFVDRLPFADEGQKYFYDPDLPGFGLCVGKRTKSYFVERQIDGRCCRYTFGKHGHFTPEQARGEAQKILYKMAVGVDPVLERQKERQTRALTLRKAWEQFRNERSLKPDTLRDYGNYMEGVFSRWMDRPLKGISRDDVWKLHRRLQRDSGPYYANSAMRVLSSVFNFVRADHGIGANPVAVLCDRRGWCREHRRQTLIKPHQLSAWFKALNEVRRLGVPPSAAVTCDYLELILFTGLRRNEAAKLRWENIDFAAKSLHIADTKNGLPHVLPLTDHLVKLLRRRKDWSGDSPWVFPSTGSKRGKGHLTEPKYVADLVAQKSEVPFTIHDLRRTFVTTAELLDLSMYAIKRLVNHKMSGDVTAGYIVTGVERLREPMKKITDYFQEKAREGPAIQPLRII